MNRLFSPRRQLGRTGFQATQLGIGDVADRAVAIETCVATICRALDAGLNVIDTAPGYENGYSEEIVGQALRAHGQREQIFMIDKIDFLDQPVAPQIDASLNRLGPLPGAGAGTAAVDLFVFHGLSDMAVWNKAASPGGGMEQLAACVRQGKARFRGISSHHPDVLHAAILSGLCDVVMFPIGPFVDHRYLDIILPLAKQRGVGTVCFKTFGAGKLLGDTMGYNRPLQNRPRQKISSGGTNDHAPVLPHLSVAACLHYTLTCDSRRRSAGHELPQRARRRLRGRPILQAAISRRHGRHSRPGRRGDGGKRCGALEPASAVNGLVILI